MVTQNRFLIINLSIFLRHKTDIFSKLLYLLRFSEIANMNIKIPRVVNYDFWDFFLRKMPVCLSWASVDNFDPKAL
jgi:hypothetical protein